MNNPIQIGITGGIGSGKTTICQMFSVLGAPIYDADSRAKWLMSHDAVLKEEVISKFGEKAYQNGELNRPFLAETVFHDEEKVAFLNGLVHPRVGDDYLTWQKEQDANYVIKEAALLFESGSADTLDAVINVSAPVETRVQRVLLRDTHRDEAQVRAIIDKQLSESARKKKASHIINNDGATLVIPQVLALHDSFMRGIVK